MIFKNAAEANKIEISPYFSEAKIVVRSGVSK
jgi:hypothetical protein